MLLTIASLIAVSQSGSTQAEPASPPPPPPPCASEQHAQFDFWVGEWEVFTPAGRKVAHSSIQRLHNGCAVREQWMPIGGTGGSSLNAYDKPSGRWKQRWIGSGGSIVDFEGGRVGEEMVLSGYWSGVNGPGQDGLVRMTYTPNEDGSVRQFGEVSTDHGLNWQVSFDFTYRPRGGDEDAE